jgi:hypothetical protein
MRAFVPRAVVAAHSPPLQPQSQLVAATKEGVAGRKEDGAAARMAQFRLSGGGRLSKWRHRREPPGQSCN